MLLHDSLEDAVADVSADLPALVAASRKQGLSIRRRRHALATVGTAAAVTALAVGGYALLPGDRPDTSTDVVDTPTATPSLSGATAPSTGRAVVAALAAAVDDVAGGTVSHFQGSDPEPQAGWEADGALQFLPATGAGPAGLVMVNLQPIAMAGATPYRCQSYMRHCTDDRLPNGDTLLTYDSSDRGEWGPGEQSLSAQVISPARRLRIIVAAHNTNPFEHDQLRARTVLSTEQLTEIATKPWWDLKRLPEEYVEAGRELPSYEGPARG